MNFVANFFWWLASLFNTLGNVLSHVYYFFKVEEWRYWWNYYKSATLRPLASIRHTMKIYYLTGWVSVDPFDFPYEDWGE